MARFAIRALTLSNAAAGDGPGGCAYGGARDGSTLAFAGLVLAFAAMRSRRR
jgi:MYXO-CTERM domain-containing protein